MNLKDLHFRPSLLSNSDNATPCCSSDLFIAALQLINSLTLNGIIAQVSVIYLTKLTTFS